MLSVDKFLDQIVKPSIKAFEQEPKSLYKAISVAWALDAYASHVAWEKHGLKEESENNPKIARIETKFKDNLETRDRQKGWKFRVIRNFSNAFKHAVRPSKDANLIEHSGLSATEERNGAAWYYQGSKHWGDQIVVSLNVSINDENGRERTYWTDKKGREYPGLLFQTIPVLDLIEDSLELIESARRD